MLYLAICEIEEEVEYVGPKLTENDFFDVDLMFLSDWQKISFGLFVNRKVTRTKIWESNNLEKVMLDDLENFIKINQDRIIITTLPVLEYIRDNRESLF
ncbi:hypothetical protein COV25_02960 [candidate division WWE3 bacterium CG10_big_fil_rev_8_21_14_0_10_35_32]|nr:MAG: hypothetical protein COV25_02960 [candidate division WWE3 bacterium CG10_big_fil_rev_8_21_14_0_10_35_32]